MDTSGREPAADRRSTGRWIVVVALGLPLALFGVWAAWMLLWPPFSGT